MDEQKEALPLSTEDLIGHIEELEKRVSRLESELNVVKAKTRYNFQDLISADYPLNQSSGNSDWPGLAISYFSLGSYSLFNFYKGQGFHCYLPFWVILLLPDYSL